MNMKILEDIRVLDFTHAWFGPYCTMMLGELGAEVIKVEPPWGTLGRLGPGELLKNVSTTFYALNLNKKDISVDLKTPEGLALIKELVKVSDVVVQNFIPGVMDRLGLGYEVLRELNSKVIYAALSGFGQYGPYSRYASFAVIGEAMSGHTYATGKRFDYEGRPINMAGSLGDVAPAMYVAFCIVAALRHRDRAGVGQMIDVSQSDCMIAFNCCESVAYDLFKESPINRRQRRPRRPDQIWDIVEVKDGWIQLAGDRLRAIDKLKEKIGVEEVTLDLVKEKITPMTRLEAFEYLVEVGFPAAPIYEAHEAIEDPHIKARETFIQVEHPVAGTYTAPNFPVKFSETPGEVTGPAPMLGQHTEEVLTDLLGKTPEQIKELEKQGIVVCWRS